MPTASRVIVSIRFIVLSAASASGASAQAPPGPVVMVGAGVEASGSCGSCDEETDCPSQIFAGDGFSDAIGSLSGWVYADASPDLCGALCDCAGVGCAAGIDWDFDLEGGSVYANAYVCGDGDSSGGLAVRLYRQCMERVNYAEWNRVPRGDRHFGVCCEQGPTLEYRSLLADVNEDGVVNAMDVAILLSFWGPLEMDHPVDTDFDGVVGPADLARVLGAWGGEG
jgi:hypothetical protein